MKQNLIKAFLIFSITIVTFSSLVYLYDVREKIFSLIKIKFGITEQKTHEENLSERYPLDEKYAKLILDGNFILFFRHAHREKWIDVPSYDAEETLQNLKAETTYFNKAVCLSDRGKIQARMMRDQLKRFKLPVSKVISSPSCRARQTAMITFGKIDEIKNVYMHYGPFNETTDEHTALLKKEISSLKPIKGKNIIISAHGNTIREKVFDEIKLKNYVMNQNQDTYKLDLDEGGFLVISNDNGKLVLEHLYFNYNDFARSLTIRPIN